MKIGDKDFQVTPVAAGTSSPPAVVLQVKVWGVPLASETVTPHQARELAGQLLQAADAAEGGAL